MRVRFSFFRLARAILFIALPLPLARWCWDERYTPYLRQVLNHMTSTPRVPWIVMEERQKLWRIQQEIHFHNLRVWIGQNKPMTRREAGLIAQALGIIGAAACFVGPVQRRAGNCAACGYSLSGLVHDADGSCRCPECGCVQRAIRALTAPR